MAYSNRGFTLQPGLVLNENEFLESNNGNYFAVLQGDHNFVIYKVVISYQIILCNNELAKLFEI